MEDKKTTPTDQPETEPPQANEAIAPKTQGSDTSVKLLGVLCIISALSIAWSLFLWAELVFSRFGGEAFCAFGSTDCAQLWDGSFASLIHRFTFVPLAGWGVIWSTAAFLLTLWALVRRAESRVFPVAASALHVMALLGLVAVGVLLTASAVSGLFCTSCAVVYVLTILWVIGVWFGLRRMSVESFRPGLIRTVILLVLVYGAVLYPGIKTPRSLVQEGRDAIPAPEKPIGSESTSSADALDESALMDFLDPLSPRVAQAVSDSLNLMRNSAVVPVRAPRALEGDPWSPVKITVFTDVLCTHCATLHESLDNIFRSIPTGSFHLEARHYPLDGHCNANLPRRGSESVRCDGARAQICMEGNDRSLEYTGRILANQQGLVREQLFEFAEPWMDREDLEACLKDSKTADYLKADVDWAGEFSPRGTPLVLVNGREGTPFGPFLYAIILAGGDPDHPAFASLPEPSSR